MCVCVCVCVCACTIFCFNKEMDTIPVMSCGMYNFFTIFFKNHSFSFYCMYLWGGEKDKSLHKKLCVCLCLCV